jgi:uncharacterized membrane protein
VRFRDQQRQPQQHRRDDRISPAVPHWLSRGLRLWLKCGQTSGRLPPRRNRFGETGLQRLLSRVRVLQALACLLVCKTVVAVILSYPSYFPPNFRSDFLLDRRAYFFGPYQWAFYAHIVSGPFTLIAGLVLISDAVRQRFPVWHRRLGRMQVLLVLCVVAPSGWWMAWYAVSGPFAAAGFATLAVVTAVCVAKGWRAAARRRFDEHRRWMLRCFVLLCSAVFLRTIGGISDVLGAAWFYPFAAWVSWLLPLFLLELLQASPWSVRLRQSSAGLVERPCRPIR